MHLKNNYKFSAETMTYLLINIPSKRPCAEQVDDQLPLGHGEKSVMLIQCYIRLTMQKVMAIRWHMGFSEAKENYNAVGQVMEKYPVVLALHEANLEATKILEVDS